MLLFETVGSTMSKKPKNKIHLYFRYVIISLAITITFFAGIFYFNLNDLMSSEGEQVVYSNEHYTLRGKPTELQKDLFKDLTAQLDQDLEYDMDAIELVVKSFIADYYTWSNKQGPFDIGGGDFIFSKENLNFKQTARRYFYSGMENFLSQGLVMTDLIEVETITTNDASFSTTFDHYGDEYISFYVEASWTYKANEKVDTSLFPNWAAFTVVQTETGRFEIVRFY